jgi:hypothetical protein
MVSARPKPSGGSTRCNHTGVKFLAFEPDGLLQGPSGYPERDYTTRRLPPWRLLFRVQSAAQSRRLKKVRSRTKRYTRSALKSGRDAAPHFSARSCS